MDGAPDTPTSEGGLGPMLGIFVLVIIFAAGGLYFLYQENKRFHTPPTEEVIGTVPTSTPEAQ